MKYYLGIDPGLNGALAFYDPISGDLEIYDMPIETIKIAGKVKNKIDIYALANIVGNHAETTKKAIIEEVSAMPKQGVTSSFNFGFSAGVATMAIAAFFISLTSVRPASWKKEMKLTSDKTNTRREASRVFPRHGGKWHLVKHDGRAEAALLAYYLFKQECV